MKEVKERASNNTPATIFKDMTKNGIKLSFAANREYLLAKDKYSATLYDDFIALAIAVRDRLVERWIETQQRYHRENVKRVYILSLEFLIGRLLGTNMINLGLWEETKKAMIDLGLDLEKLRNLESDAGLGNGGLGRLAACFLDTMATFSIPAHGYGIRYEYGIFNQRIINGYQVEFPDEWLSRGNPWEFQRSEYSFKVRFGGHTHSYTDEHGNFRVEWLDTDDVIAMPYDIPVPGYRNNCVNTLRLWSARSSEDFDLSYFNDGDYERAVYSKMLTENISKVLYPNDNVSQGRELRLKQEYFFTAASIADIMRRFKTENSDFAVFPDKVTIQLNDTHPSIAILELMRILVDEIKMDWDKAWEIAIKTFAYTNHTIMPEALERWPVGLFEKLLPRHLQVLYEINFRFLKEVAAIFPGDNERLKRMSLIEEGNPKKIRMANLAIIGSHSINGVSELHTELLKTQLFRDFYDIYPERFNNKTNGVTQRRWLEKANFPLSQLISNTVGENWVTDLYELERLEPLCNDPSFREKWIQARQANKNSLAKHIHDLTGIRVNPESLFDSQVKRMHEYKRQSLFGLYMLSHYIRLKQGGDRKKLLPRVFIVSGKAAPGYYMAKLIIKFITSIADIVNKDRSIDDMMKIVFLENYRVSLAEKIFPATDISEQISTAGTEASGTGCMKFMMNGALTIGTYDGANLEMAKAVGKDNIFLFGHTTSQLQSLRARGYDPHKLVERCALLKDVFRLMESNFLSPVEFGLFRPLIDSLLGPDPFFVCADFEPYLKTQDMISAVYADPSEWVKKSILNVAKSGRFSSDRTIEEYCRDIWKIPFGKR